MRSFYVITRLSMRINLFCNLMTSHGKLLWNLREQCLLLRGWVTREFEPPVSTSKYGHLSQVRSSPTLPLIDVSFPPGTMVKRSALWLCLFVSTTRPASNKYTKNARRVWLHFRPRLGNLRVWFSKGFDPPFMVWIAHKSHQWFKYPDNPYLVLEPI